MEFTGKNDTSQKAACDASPACSVTLPAGVYIVRALNDHYKELDFEVTVGAGNPDTVSRTFVEFDVEREVSKLLAK